MGVRMSHELRTSLPLSFSSTGVQGVGVAQQAEP